MKKEIIIILGLLVVVILAITGAVVISKTKENPPKRVWKEPKKYTENNFNINLIKTINSTTQQGNYLISPYSIEIALNMLKEGSSGETKEELEKVLNNRTIPDLSIKEKIGVANAIFLKEIYKDSIEKTFTNTIQEKYQGEIIYDKFQNPKKINDWVSNKTNKMIEKILDTISPDFILGIANALAIDVEWQSEFKCDNTSEKEFEKLDNTKVKVEMMHKLYEYGAKYFETNNAKGAIIPYRTIDGENNKELEFVAILPNEKANTYIENLTEEELEEIDSNSEEISEEVHLRLALPRFQYDFDVNNFKDVLKAMGIKKAFDEETADFTRIMTKENRQKNNIKNIFVSDAIHKTHIELNEKGTKAAAITYFGLNETTAAYQEKKPIIKEVLLEKSFLYMIREVNTKEILFFGLVDEPNKWKKSTCKD